MFVYESLISQFRHMKLITPHRLISQGKLDFASDAHFEMSIIVGTGKTL